MHYNKHKQTKIIIQGLLAIAFLFKTTTCCLAGINAQFYYEAHAPSHGENRKCDPFITYSIWVVIKNESQVTINFPTGLTHTSIGGRKNISMTVTMEILDKANPFRLKSIMPLSELKIVELRPGESTVFKYRGQIYLPATTLASTDVNLRISKEIGQRYSCWSGELEGALVDIEMLHAEPRRP